MKIDLESVLFENHIQIQGGTKRAFSTEEGYRLIYAVKEQVVVVSPGGGVARMVPVSNVTFMVPSDLSQIDAVSAMEEAASHVEPVHDAEVVTLPHAKKRGRPAKS